MLLSLFSPANDALSCEEAPLTGPAIEAPLTGEGAPAIDASLAGKVLVPISPLLKKQSNSIVSSLSISKKTLA